MKYPTRINYTAANRAMMFDRWQKGDPLNSIAFWTHEIRP